MNPLEDKFYEGARTNFDLARRNQIKQGFEEYGRTYDPANFTAFEQFQHFISELPDILHYGYGMFKTIEAKEKEIEKLKIENMVLKQKLEKESY